MNLTYLMLKPWRLFAQKYVGMVDILDDKKGMEDFLRMEKWIFDSPDQAGEAFREFNTQFFQENRFVTGGAKVGERDVHLGLVEMPILNIFAEQDHLVPPDASRALRDLAGTDDYTELSFKGGHIGIYVSSRAKQVPETIHDWLAKRSR
ncbi:MAG: class III poly(R)-hydroxyalkanoic acid synthase subunit PhaC, partial [Pseudomonadota bacterium]|nr:class III poly(R)-hydroxyalkanoic acid synthase subunit PhaC [Pseudomonadota bacterium]